MWIIQQNMVVEFTLRAVTSHLYTIDLDIMHWYHHLASIADQSARTISDISFFNNTARRGGAQYFDLYSNFSLFQTAHVHFQDNRATEFGGAIYVADVLGPSQFLSEQHIPFRSECFFHMFGKSLGFHTTPLVFVKNSAGIRGSVVYGGLLIR